MLLSLLGDVLIKIFISGNVPLTFDLQGFILNRGQGNLALFVGGQESRVMTKMGVMEYLWLHQWRRGTDWYF